MFLGTQVVSSHPNQILTALILLTETFELSIDPGEFTDSEILVMLGENGKVRLNANGSF